jgi:tryptophan synthase alpha chain
VNRLDRLFQRLRGESRCGLIAYVTCGDPDRETTVAAVREIVRAGADAIELGVPFSDPIADGPVIQAAAQRALDGGTTMGDLFGIAASIRRVSEVPLIAFSYFNPVARYGAVRFAAEAVGAGIDAVLLTDLPPEEGKGVRSIFAAAGLPSIYLAAPTTSEERLGLIGRASGSFVYYVSTTGVTGTRDELPAGLTERLDAVRAAVGKPLAVGFGISTRAHYEAVERHCDAVVVGSAIVRAMAAGEREGAPARAASVVRGIVGARVEGRGLRSED